MGQLQEDIAELRDLLAVYEKLDATQPGARALRRALARLAALASLSEGERAAILDSYELVMHWHKDDGGKGSQAEHYRRLARFAALILSTEGG